MFTVSEFKTCPQEKGQTNLSYARGVQVVPRSTCVYFCSTAVDSKVPLFSRSRDPLATRIALDSCKVQSGSLGIMDGRLYLNMYTNTSAKYSVPMLK